MTDDDTTVKQLLAMPEATFRRVIDSDLRGQAEAPVSAALRSDKLVERWYATLSAMSKSVEGQLAARRADADAFFLQTQDALSKAENSTLANELQRQLTQRQMKDAEWRASTIRFKTGLEETMMEARRLRENLRGGMYDSVVTEERNRALDRVKELEDAIRSHRDHECSDECEDRCWGDDLLWKLVN